MLRTLFDRDTWQEIFGSIEKNKLRTVVTVIGVLWGIFIYITLSGASKGLDNGFEREFEEVAINSLFVWAQNTSIPYDGFRTGRRMQLKLDDEAFLNKRIPQLQYIIAPDTIIRPSNNSVIFKVVKAKVHDANGLDDVRRVGFVSYHVEGDSFLNKGNLINLYDDGSEVIIYEPNFTSGDSIANDAIYSFRVPIFGSGNVDPSLQTKTGTFNWIFDAMDMSNTYSDTVIHTVVVE